MIRWRRRRPSGEDRGRSMMALPPRAPAVASESSEAKLASSVAARDQMVSVAYGSSTVRRVSGSTSGSGTSSATYTSSRSVLSSDELGLQLLFIDDGEKVRRRERTKHLVMEYSLERWLSEMGIGWVLDLADDPSAGTSLLRTQAQRNNLTESWIRALTEITEYVLHLEYTVIRKDMPARVQLLKFVQATIPKMLPFVDTLLATAGVSNWVQAPSVKLQALLGVHNAVSSASECIHSCFNWNLWEEMEAHWSKLLNLLSEKEHRLEEAIWNMMEEVRTGILNDDDDDDEWGIQISQGSPDICKVTRSIVTYIKSLRNNNRGVDHIVYEAAELGSYVPNCDIISSFLLSTEQDEPDTFTMLTLEMVFSLEVKLAKRSESFPHHSLRFLFLVNNTHFIQQQLHPLFSMTYHTEVLTPKIEDYKQKYLQASWAPVMSCLNNDTPQCFRKNAALPKFDLEFQKTYTAQKLWKVPEPELRTRLRKAIVEEVVPGLTKYLENYNITSPEVNPQEWEKMLLELFEG